MNKQIYYSIYYIRATNFKTKDKRQNSESKGIVQQELMSSRRQQASRIWCKIHEHTRFDIFIIRLNNDSSSFCWLFARCRPRQLLRSLLRRLLWRCLRNAIKFFALLPLKSFKISPMKNIKKEKALNNT